MLGQTASRVLSVSRRLVGALVAVLLFAGPQTPVYGQASNWRTEFWGTEIPVPNSGRFHRVSDIYLDRRGDLRILFSYKPPLPDGSGIGIHSTFAVYSAAQKSIVIEFGFTQANRLEMSKKLEAYFSENSEVVLKAVLSPDRIKLSGGGYLRGVNNSNPNRCVIPYNGFISRQDEAGKEIESKMVIQLRAERFPFFFPRECEFNDRGDLRNGDLISVHGRDLGHIMYDLGDGTWLLNDDFRGQHNAGPPAVIRFRGFMESPYLAERSDLLVVDNAEVYRTFRRDGPSNVPPNTIPSEHGDRLVFERYRDRLPATGSPGGQR